MAERYQKQTEEGDGLKDKLVYLNRVAKVVKGGKRFNFSALVVVGDGNGKDRGGQGQGSGSAGGHQESCRAGQEEHGPRFSQGRYDPAQMLGHYGAGKVLLKPASEGTGLIAGGASRSVLEVVGVRNVLCKSLGSSNPHNVVSATINGLDQTEKRRAGSSAARQVGRGARIGMAKIRR